MNGPIELKITSIRKRGASFGGAIVAGEVAGEAEKRIVVFSHKILPDASLIQVGQSWRVTGPIRPSVITLLNGFVITETAIDAERAELLIPSGEDIIKYIARHPDIRGVGQIKAARLYTLFGTRLLDIIRARDVAKLCLVVGIQKARAICDAFAQMDFGQAFLLLDRIGLSREMAQKVFCVYGARACEKVTDNPYQLLSFRASWKLVDEFARNWCGIAEDAETRLHAAIEEALYRGFDKGSTAVQARQLKEGLIRLLGDGTAVEIALKLGHGNGQYYRFGDTYHPAGAWIMERYLAQRLAATYREHGDGSAQTALTENAPVTDEIEKAMRIFERDEGYPLTDEQKRAVKTSALHPISLVLGSASVGKTAILKCLYAVIQATHSRHTLYQCAFTREAAQRMREVTGCDSYTIASFLKSVRGDAIPPGAWIVVDELETVDVITFYGFMRHIPNSCRLILIGDPYGLPPVGPGLVLHALVETWVPQTTLTVVKHQSDESGIPIAAAAVCQGCWPPVRAFRDRPDRGVSIVECAPEDITEQVGEVYATLGGEGSSYEVQVLTPTRSGYGGADPINILLQNRYKADQAIISYLNGERGKADWANPRSHFRVSDLVMFTKTDHGRELRNGSLGKIIRRLECSSANDPVCIALFDGREHEMYRPDLTNMELAYALMVHKSLGAKFRRVIVPVRPSKALGRTLLYTAITRAIEEVVLVGDTGAVRAALDEVSAIARGTALSSLIRRAQ